MAVRVALITGASSGLGAALAGLYAAPGVMLGLIARDRPRLDAVAAACRARGAVVVAEAIDIAGERERLAAWLAAFDAAHPVELVIANAGVSAGPALGSVVEPVELTAHQVAVNLLGAVGTVVPLLPAMVARRRGRVALIASLAAYRGLPYSPGYCASKAGLRAWGEALRPLCEPHGVGVTVVCPGFFASPMTARWAGPTPLLASTERAARIVKRGIDRGRRRVGFPWPLTVGLRLCDALPAALGDRIVRRFRFAIRPA
ncbi:MAG TPA: SDR family NAD(P)-dependent oxidoreductase [Stellaceae bacterium]|nr:SDR family NAD(P)-dependent oxidoreductase [Stellaceae bacterium]